MAKQRSKRAKQAGKYESRLSIGQNRYRHEQTEHVVKATIGNIVNLVNNSSKLSSLCTEETNCLWEAEDVEGVSMI